MQCTKHSSSSSSCLLQHRIVCVCVCITYSRTARALAPPFFLFFFLFFFKNEGTQMKCVYALCCAGHVLRSIVPRRSIVRLTLVSSFDALPLVQALFFSLSLSLLFLWGSISSRQSKMRLSLRALKKKKKKLFQSPTARPGQAR